MLHKEVRLQIKTSGDEGIFEGYASTFGNEDLGGDIVAPGAFSRTIAQRKDIPILWGHRSGEVIGVNQEFTEDAKGLLVKGQLEIKHTDRARSALALMKMGAIRGLSIGYDPIQIDYSREKEGIRILKEIKLYEYSLTAFPMNEEAQVTGVKEIRSAADLERIIEQVVNFKGEIRPEVVARILEKVSALRAKPEPATHEQADPDSFHSACDRITNLLAGA